MEVDQPHYITVSISKGQGTLFRTSQQTLALVPKGQRVVSASISRFCGSNADTGALLEACPSKHIPSQPLALTVQLREVVPDGVDVMYRSVNAF
jgi:hypothetical protein